MPRRHTAQDGIVLPTDDRPSKNNLVLFGLLMVMGSNWENIPAEDEHETETFFQGLTFSSDASCYLISYTSMSPWAVVAVGPVALLVKNPQRLVGQCVFLMPAVYPGFAGPVFLRSLFPKARPDLTFSKKAHPLPKRRRNSPTGPQLSPDLS